MNVWIARDADGGLFMFNSEPEWNSTIGEWSPAAGGGYSHWPNDEMFLEVKNGQCRAAKVELIPLVATARKKEVLF